MRSDSRSISSVCAERRRSTTVLRAVSTSLLLCVISMVLSEIWGGKGVGVGMGVVLEVTGWGTAMNGAQEWGSHTALPEVSPASQRDSPLERVPLVGLGSCVGQGLPGSVRFPPQHCMSPPHG